MKLNDLPPLQKKTFTGAYRLTGRAACFDDDGVPCSKLRLSSCTDDIVVLAAINRMAIPERLSHIELVIVKGYVCMGVKESAILLTYIRRLFKTDVVRQPALQALPLTFCPQPEHLDQLIESVRALESEHLQMFIKRVLERQDRLEVSMKAPAIKNYHPLCAHDDLTLEACAFGLTYLDKADPQAAITLRHIWTSASPGARYGMSAAMTLARYVRDADGQSVKADNQRKASNRRELQGSARLGRNAYWLTAFAGSSLIYDAQNQNRTPQVRGLGQRGVRSLLVNFS